MAWQPSYVTPTELKAYLRITDTADDTQIQFAIDGASRSIDQECNRQFGVTTAVARYYEWDGAYLEGQTTPYAHCYAPILSIDDIQSTTSLEVLVDTENDGTYATEITVSTDFDFWPWNAAANGKPWTHLVLRPTSSVLTQFPSYDRAVKITGLWGWTSVPEVVKQATLIQASRFFSRRNSPYGVAGSPDLGNEIRLLSRVDPDVAVLLGTVKRRFGAV